MCMHLCLPLPGYTPVNDKALELASRAKKVCSEVDEMLSRVRDSGGVDPLLMAKAKEHLDLLSYYFTKAVLTGPGALSEPGEPTS